MRVVVVLGLVVGAGAVLLLARDDAQQAALEDANSAVAPAPGLAATGRSPESKLHADVRALLEELSKADTDQARIQVLSRHRGKRFPHHPALVAQLVELLQSQDDGVRWYAVYTLQGFGPEAGPAVTALLASDLPEVRRVALHVLHGWLGRKQAIPEVDWLTLLDDDNAPVSNMALNCLMQGVAYDEAIAG
ncbi:MAG: HEAT repeat domain-containing protein, partial [Planctomycetota bacterium]|nr:HEAT repeat domain-containing protein [Planctomycetota bacterium]